VYGFIQIGERVLGVTQKRLKVKLENGTPVVRLLIDFDFSDIKCVRNKDVFIQSYLKFNEVDCNPMTSDGWLRFGSMSGYDNENCDDDPNAGCLQGLDGCGCNKAQYAEFLNDYPIASVAKEDWETMKYKKVELRIVQCDEDVKYTKKEGYVYIFDECDNKDCPGADKQCCTRNKNKYVPKECEGKVSGMLFDTEKTALKNQFGIDNFDNVACEVEYKIVGELTSEEVIMIKQKYNLLCEDSYCSS